MYSISDRLTGKCASRAERCHDRRVIFLEPSFGCLADVVGLFVPSNVREHGPPVTGHSNASQFPPSNVAACAIRPFFGCVVSLNGSVAASVGLFGSQVLRQL